MIEKKAFLDNWDSKKSGPIIDFGNEFSSTSASCLIETLLKEVKPVVTEKYAFEYEDQSHL